ncbi:hypothetical protein [Desulfonema magnum]|uniref:Uncharacterized protein n=1 Tax=Desulfonema magnum TaxID=45655 RepID=A0A975BPA8_9BACT|nr:hypothetical protein [Desulfonema magnum]QTA89212.1 Uncharacterized protein dnm_052620 [Desulfonema magnum]
MKTESPVLPIFVRWTWTGYQARKVWETRVRRVMQAWPQIEIASVSEGLRACTFLRTPPQDVPVLRKMLNRQGLIVAQCPATSPVPLKASTKAEYHSMDVVIGSEENAALFINACERHDHDEIGRMLGYPECCRKFYLTVCAEQKHIDTVWQAAGNTRNGSQTPLKTLIETEGDPKANMILHKMNLKAVPHLPCSFDCSETAIMADQFADLGKRIGYKDEMEWLHEILSWPMEWSALHGIAEIKLPVFKMITNTDVTSDMRVVRRISSVFPEEGARGLTFPYNQ